MANASPSTPTSDPSNGQLIFATLRDLFAELYSAENDARVVVDDAGLDAKQIAFSARAQTNWHHILSEAVRQHRLDLVLAIALTAYPDNPRLKDAYTQSTLFTKQGGEITPPDHLAIDNPGPTVKTEGGAYVARNVSTAQGDFVGRDKLIAGDEVGGNKIEGDPIDARESRGLIIHPSGPVTQHYGNTVEGGIHYTIYNYSSPISSASSARDDSSRCPYKGLLHFGPDDANFFFGREKVIAELVQLTNKRTAIPILGASGSGKSSLVLAGLVPALQRSGGWKFVHFRPGNDPFLSLAKALMPLYEPTLNKREQTKEARKIADDLRNNHLTIADIMEGIQREVGVQGRLLLIADQFEELFTLCPDEKVHHQFLDNLIQSCQPIDLPYSPLVIIFALRADFLAVALNNHAFAEVLRFDVKLGPMTQEELRQAIEVPAQKLGVSFEEGLVERIQQGVENKPGNLPLLEFALSLLWDERTGEQITHDAYEAIGQVEGALARHANHQYDRLSNGEKELAQYIFTQLVHPGRGTEDTRQIAIMNELDKNTWPVIRKLADLRLVVTSQNANGQEIVEVVHEALIRNWGKLEEWMNQIRAFRVWQEQLRFELKRWNDSGQDEGALLRGTFLAEAKDWLKERSRDLGQAEHEFIQASIKQHEQDQQEKREAERNKLVLMIRTQRAADLDLSQADLAEAKLQAANLQAAKLLEANLQAANLRGANLQGANLQNAKLQGANLQRANLQRANLQAANLQGANLQWADLRGADLRGANLQGADLQGANLQGANLQGGDLQGAIIDDTTDIDPKWRLVWQIINQGAADRNLSQAKLQGADLQGAKLQGADLQGANLLEANLRGANLQNAKLQEANLQEANLQEANLRGANLQGANLQNAKLQEANLQEANLQEANLQGANLQNANLQEANLQRADLRGAIIDDTTDIDPKWRLVWQIINQGAADRNLSQADLQGANLQGANLQGANLQRANLQRADLAEVKLQGADLQGANLQGANLEEADLQRADLQRADLQRADLQGADLQRAKLQGTKLQGTKLHGANLQEANLQGANLQRADLQGANLQGADLQGANLQGAALQGTNLQGANLLEAKLQEANLQGANLGDTYLVNTKYDKYTKWPRDFNPELAGAIKTESTRD